MTTLSTLRAAALALIAAAAPPHVRALDDHATHDHAEATDAHVAEAHGLRALHAWMNATEARDALVYVEIANHGDAVATLLGGETDAAEGARLVAFRLLDGAPDYPAIDALPLEPGAEIALRPFGLALRLTGLAAPLAEGDAVELRLLTDRGALPVVVAVEAADATQHGHAGHAH